MIFSQKYTFCVLGVLLLAGCALYVNPSDQVSEARLLAKSFVGKSKNDLISRFPNIEVDEIGKDEFRYTIRYQVKSTATENLAAGQYRRPNTYMEIWFFSDKDEIIHRYDLRRVSK